MHPSVGFQNAKKLLEERFGHPFTIASNYVTKLTEGAPLKPTDRAGLLAFADQLKNCEHTLRSIGYLEEINSADNLRRIVQRLPFHLRAKFVEVADSIQQSGQRANISHIADFVKVKASAANNPVFGSVVDVTRDRAEISRRRPSSKTRTSSFERVTTLSTHATNHEESAQRRTVCPACDGRHSFTRCHIFETKPFEERQQIMRKAQLCHNCFKYGRIAVGCLAKGSCQVQGCTRRHHTLLYPPDRRQPLNRAEAAPLTESQDGSSPPAPGGQSHSTSCSEKKICLRIVPVKVRSHDSGKTVKTYALLDNGSDVSLCDNDLAMELGVRGDFKTFYLTTQEKEDSPKVGLI